MTRTIRVALTRSQDSASPAGAGARLTDSPFADQARKFLPPTPYSMVSATMGTTETLGGNQL